MSFQLYKVQFFRQICDNFYRLQKRLSQETVAICNRTFLKLPLRNELKANKQQQQQKKSGEILTYKVLGIIQSFLSL